MEKYYPPFFNEEYNNQSNLLDGLYEFHPGYFDELPPQELEILNRYYLFATSSSNLPDNIFKYRIDLLSNHPDLEDTAKKIYKKLLQKAGIELE